MPYESRRTACVSATQRPSSLTSAIAYVLISSASSAVKYIEAYIAGNEVFKKQYAAILQRVLDLKYGNELGQAVMKQQLEKHGK